MLGLRFTLAVTVVVADPHRDGHIIGEADEPAVDGILGAAAAAAMAGHKDHVIAGKALKVVRKRVRANKRRLSRR